MIAPIASVIIVNYNGKHFLPACLEALHAQTLPKDAFEVIVSDNGSTDGSLELLRSNYTWVKVIENGRNTGFATGNNIGFKAARGKYLIALNNDTAASSDWLEKLVQFAEEHPQAGIVNGHSRLFYNQLVVTLESDSFIPDNLDTRTLGIMVSSVDSGADYGVVQYLQGFYGWEKYKNLRYRWTNGCADLGVPVPPGDGDWTLTLQLSAPRSNHPPVHTRLKLRNALLGEWDVSGLQPQMFEIKMPADSRRFAKPLVQNAGSEVNHNGYGKDRGTYSANNEMFFEEDSTQYPCGPVFAACGVNMLIRRTMLEEIGAFDDHFFMYYEDIDLSWRARLMGWEVMYTNDAIIRHIHCGSSKEWSPLFLFWVERNRLAMLLKSGSPRQFFFNWIRFFLGVGKHTLSLLKSLILRKPGKSNQLRSLKIQYKVAFSLFVWLPILVWQRLLLRSHLRTASKEIEPWFLS
jgi:O-antigen biosynthesis protein